VSRTHVTVSFATHSNVSSISSHTACYLGRPKQLATEIANRRKAVCQIACSKRTTVCRIFSCQRAAECFLPHPASNLLVARHGGPTFAACGSFGAQPSHGLPIHPRAPRYGGQADLACQPKLASPCAGERRLVENTGLEPVTSWLQTRRSPS
jgi:hypothetical protein